jgi:biotin carboxyl carrier protein
MGLTSDDLQVLLEAFEDGAWLEMTVVDGADRLHVSRRPEAVVHRVTDELASPGPAVSVAAPSIGIFLPTVSPGETVGRHDTVGMIEVSDAVRPVPAGVAGRITAVPADDGAMVEYGDPLVVVTPEPRTP